MSASLCLHFEEDWYSSEFLLRFLDSADYGTINVRSPTFRVPSSAELHVIIISIIALVRLGIQRHTGRCLWQVAFSRDCEWHRISGVWHLVCHSFCTVPRTAPVLATRTREINFSWILFLMEPCIFATDYKRMRKTPEIPLNSQSHLSHTAKSNINTEHARYKYTGTCTWLYNY